jgi:dTDP-4-amino-4,6-dideoxygalactose transaminase
VKIQLDQIGMNREQIFSALRAENIGVNVHYMPVYRHPLYKLVGTNENNRCLTAESVYEQLLSLPIFPDMTNEDVSHVVDAIEKLHN